MREFPPSPLQRSDSDTSSNPTPSLMVPPPAPPGGSTRKRRSQSFAPADRDDQATPPSVKRLRRGVGLGMRKDAHQTSYSKPGVPTPAKGRRAGDVSQGSLNLSTASSALNTSTVKTKEGKGIMLEQHGQNDSSYAFFLYQNGLRYSQRVFRKQRSRVKISEDSLGSFLERYLFRTHFCAFFLM